MIRFGIDSGMIQECFMFSWLFNIYMDAVMQEVKMEMGRRELRFLEEGREWILPGLLYEDDLALRVESEENQRAMLGRFVEVFRRRGLQVRVR